MGTQLINNDEIDFKALKVGDQFLKTIPSGIYDSHVSSIVSKALSKIWYQIRSLNINYEVNRSAYSDTKYNEYINIFDKTFKTYGGPTEGFEIHYVSGMNGIIKGRLKNNKMLGSFSVIERDRPVYNFFCAIPLENSFLVTVMEIQLEHPFIRKSIKFSIIDGINYKMNSFRVEDNKINDFINFIENNISTPEFIRFKKEVIEGSMYTIHDYLNKADSSNFIKLFKEENARPYLEPVYSKDGFELRINWDKNKAEVIGLYNGIPASFVSSDYSRIKEQLYEFYFDVIGSGVSHVNPFTGESVCQDWNVIYKDAGGLIVEVFIRQDKRTYSYTKINDVYVHSIDNEANEIEDRKKMIQIMTNGNNIDADDDICK